ncbi:MAG: deoxyribodipyrimidine photo-lyase, partial [Sphingomonas sp.]
KGSRLILRRGRSDDVLAQLAKEVGAARVHCIRHYEPWWRNAERAVSKRLDLLCHDGNYLAPPGSITTGAGQPYKIYTPFWRALQARMPPPDPIRRPAHIPLPLRWPESDKLADWRLLPSKPDWAQGFAAGWTPGEQGAHVRLEHFHDGAPDYDETRNLPSIEGSSRLSPHLHFGEISPAQVWHGTARRGGSVDTFLGEIGWRDYAQNLILQFPDYAATNGREALDNLAWRSGPAAKKDLEAWRQGRTGYPIVDAGMRQLWATGWMHNRVRMIAASFLIKHLLIDWREGEAWFWDCLVDADYGNNSVNWQWTAGTGVDSNMFARIMAPLVQSEKFRAGDYIRRWVPELKNLTDAAIHDPDKAGCRPAAYPAKIIGHREARERALAAARKAR